MQQIVLWCLLLQTVCSMGHHDDHAAAANCVVRGRRHHAAVYFVIVLAYHCQVRSDMTLTAIVVLTEHPGAEHQMTRPWSGVTQGHTRWSNHAHHLHELKQHT